MDKLILSLAPAFAAGLAIQQLLELADRFVEQVLKILGPSLSVGIDKKLILGLISLFVALIITIGGGLRVLQPLDIEAGFVDVIVTSLIISAGTESINSIVKFLGYTKERKDPSYQSQDVAKNDSISK